MGEMADDIIDGASCELCGVYFKDDHGYPVVCKHCWSQLTKAERKNHQLATEKEIT